jgi:hypothetical protein
MKKCSFVKFIRVHDKLLGGFNYQFIKDVELGGSFSEIPTSMHEFLGITFTKFDDIDSNTNVIIAIDCVDITDGFKIQFKKFVDSLNCKAIFVDFATYDEQEISEESFDIIENLIDRPCYFISKNLLQNRPNHFYFEVLFYHHINHIRDIPRYINSYRHLKLSQRNIWAKNKAFYYPGHIRFHKVKFLNFLHENDFLKDTIWSCTGLDFDKALFEEFVPPEFKDEFFTFDVLKLLPKRIDFDIFSTDTYNQRGGIINLVTYLDTYFEFVPETRFYNQSGLGGSKKTHKSWNNISEKTIKPTCLSHPFIQLTKPNTISILENFGLKYRFDFWDFHYDSIEDDNERMTAVQNFTKKVMNMSHQELREFNNDYYYFSKNNYEILLNDVYKKSIVDIYNAF